MIEEGVHIRNEESASCICLTRFNLMFCLIRRGVKNCGRFAPEGLEKKNDFAPTASRQ